VELTRRAPPLASTQPGAECCKVKHNGGGEEMALAVSSPTPSQSPPPTTFFHSLLRAFTIRTELHMTDRDTFSME